MASSQFKFKVGERVYYTPDHGLKKPGPILTVHIVARTIEAALGKTYQIRYRTGHLGGFVEEKDLHKIERNKYL